MELKVRVIVMQMDFQHQSKGPKLFITGFIASVELETGTRARLEQ